MNPNGAIAIAGSIAGFFVTVRLLQPRSLRFRLLMLGAWSVLAIPAILFAVYYLHFFGEREWFYTLRSWRGSELLAVFLGCAGGAVASLLPRLLLGVPLFAVLILTIVPHLKPLIGPLPDSSFRERWAGEVSLQSTPSTCGPASLTTILRSFGLPASERATARAAFSYSGGTEAWYLARYARSRGLSAHFDFRRTFSPAAGQPVLVGVRLGGVGHFIAVLSVRDDQVTFADPLHGEERLPLAAFQHRYDFTGFHLVFESTGAE